MGAGGSSRQAELYGPGRAPKFESFSEAQHGSSGGSGVYLPGQECLCDARSAGGPNRRAAASPELRRLRRAPGRSGRPGLDRGVLQLLTLLPLPGLQGTPLRGAEFCKSSPKSPKRSFREAQSSAALRGASAGRAAVASVPQARLRASAVALSPESFAGMLEHRPGLPMRPQLVGTGCLGVSGGWDAVPVLAQPDRRDWSVR